MESLYPPTSSRLMTWNEGDDARRGRTDKATSWSCPKDRRHGNLAWCHAATYRRRVEFAETDAAGIVHFSVFFRYMEEAEHALWRNAGMASSTSRESDQLAAHLGPLRFQGAAQI